MFGARGDGQTVGCLLASLYDGDSGLFREQYVESSEAQVLVGRIFSFTLEVI